MNNRAKLIFAWRAARACSKHPQMFVLRNFILSLMLLVTAVVAAADKTERFKGFRCRGLFDATAPLAFPSGWPFEPEVAEAYYDLLPLENREHIWHLAQFTEFVDNLPAAFYEELGTMITFDAYSELKPPWAPTGSEEELNRFYQIMAARNFALGPATGDPDYIRVLMRSLALHFGGALAAQPWQPDRLLAGADLSAKDFGNPDKTLALFAQYKAIVDFYRSRAQNLPPLESFLRHSEEALLQCVLHVLHSEKQADPTNIYILNKLMVKSLKGEAVTVPPHLESSFKAVHELIASGKDARLEKAQYDLFTSSLVELIGRFAETQIKPPADDFTTYYAWVDYIHHDVVVDHGWIPFLKALFVEVLMERPTLSGEQMKLIIRGQVEYLLRKRRAELLKYFELNKPQNLH